MFQRGFTQATVGHKAVAAGKSPVGRKAAQGAFGKRPVRAHADWPDGAAQKIVLPSLGASRKNGRELNIVVMTVSSLSYRKRAMEVMVEPPSRMMVSPSPT